MRSCLADEMRCTWWCRSLTDEDAVIKPQMNGRLGLTTRHNSKDRSQRAVPVLCRRGAQVALGFSLSSVQWPLSVFLACPGGGAAGVYLSPFQSPGRPNWMQGLQYSLGQPGSRPSHTWLAQSSVQCCTPVYLLGLEARSRQGNVART